MIYQAPLCLNPFISYCWCFMFSPWC